jgi:hypothetical protein
MSLNIKMCQNISAEKKKLKISVLARVLEEYA